MTVAALITHLVSIPGALEMPVRLQCPNGIRELSEGDLEHFDPAFTDTLRGAKSAIVINPVHEESQQPTGARAGEI